MYMKHTWKSAVGATAGVLAITGGLLAGAVLPAAAAPAFNEAFATQAFGIINSAPTAVAQFPGISPVTLPFSVIPGLLITGPIDDQADGVSASSVITGVLATQLGKMDLTALGVGAGCTLGDGVSGGAEIIGGKIAGIHGRPIMLPVHPRPNTQIRVPDGLVLTLNRQFTIHAGTVLIVQAIHASMLGGAETLTIGAAGCNDRNLTPSPTSTNTVG
jgi:hypothetical protein